MLVHNVFFSLKDHSEASKQRLLEACKKYLASHAGIVHFACGMLAEDLKRSVNDRDFDVGLHIVFASKVDHDKYQEAPAHLQFIAESKDNWQKVRVFDSVIN